MCLTTAERRKVKEKGFAFIAVIGVVATLLILTFLLAAIAQNSSHSSERTYDKARVDLLIHSSVVKAKAAAKTFGIEETVTYVLEDGMAKVNISFLEANNKLYENLFLEHKEGDVLLRIDPTVENRQDNPRSVLTNINGMRVKDIYLWTDIEGI